MGRLATAGLAPGLLIAMRSDPISLPAMDTKLEPFGSRLPAMSRPGPTVPPGLSRKSKTRPLAESSCRAIVVCSTFARDPQQTQATLTSACCVQDQHAFGGHVLRQATCRMVQYASSASAMIVLSGSHIGMMCQHMSAHLLQRPFDAFDGIIGKVC